jgi:hypothetical protein
MDLKPIDLPDYAIPAWLACLSWAIGEPEIVAAFRAETRVAWQPGRTPLEIMIDKSTKADEWFIKAFVEWFNANVWGSWADEEAS